MKLDESLFKENYKVGDTIKIINMAGEPQYNGRSGVIDHIDSIGQLHGTWGSLAIVPEEDEIEIIKTDMTAEALDMEAKDRKAKRASDYRRFANMKEDDVINEDAMDDWAVRRTCRINNCSKEQLMDALKESKTLTEADQTLADAAKAAQEIDDEKIVKSKGQIVTVLDEALDYTLEQKDIGEKSWTNVLLIGEAGTGKTSIVRQWARDNNINLYEVRAAGMDDTDLGGAISKGEGDYSNVVVRLASTEFDKLNRPNSVLFLDEYNRAPKSVRTNLLELINSHVVPDPRTESGQRYLENFLFTVAAINPATSLYDTDTLDMAERTRFRNIDVNPEPRELLKHLTKVFKEAADKASNEVRKQRAEGRLKLATALLTNKNFDFDTKEDIEKSVAEDKGNGLALNYRTLTELLKGSNGTKEDFLRKWNEYCNSNKKPMVERILSNYQDIDDKANAALKSDTESPVFGKSLNNNLLDKLLNSIDELD